MSSADGEESDDVMHDVGLPSNVTGELRELRERVGKLQRMRRKAALQRRFDVNRTLDNLPLEEETVYVHNSSKYLYQTLAGLHNNWGMDDLPPSNDSTWEASSDPWDDELEVILC